MKIYDLSHKLNNLTPVYPGNHQPEFTKIADFESHGYRETQLRFHSHLGTHIDAPAHMMEDGKTLDQLPVEHFCGNAFIIKTPINRNIDFEFLKGFETEIGQSEFVLFQTGWSQFWGTPEYFGRFPVLTNDAIEFLLQFNLKGIGFDHISADTMDSTDFPNHYAILGNNLIIIENLVFPDGFNDSKGEFSCFPLPYENADGSPVRAVLKCKRA